MAPFNHHDDGGGAGRCSAGSPTMQRWSSPAAAAAASDASDVASGRRRQRRRQPGAFTAATTTTAVVLAAVAAAAVVVVNAAGAAAFVAPSPSAAVPRHAATGAAAGAAGACRSRRAAIAPQRPPPTPHRFLGAAATTTMAARRGGGADDTAAPPRRKAGKKAPPPPPLPVALRAEQVVEVWRGGQLVFGNFEGRPDPAKGSVRVRLEHGESVAVDAGQLTGAWASAAASADDEDEEGSGFLSAASGEGDSPSQPPPTTPEGWAALRLRAGKAMRGLTPRALEMEAFWGLAMQRWKRAKLTVDSAHLAAFLFRRKEYEAALKREVQAAAAAAAAAAGDEDGEGGGSATTTAAAAALPPPSVRLPPVSPSQRYAAAVLLASESFRFKRCVPTLTPSSAATAAVGVVGAGYRPLEPSVVHSREVLSFTQAVRSMEERRKLLLLAAAEAEAEVEGDGEGTGAGATAAAGGHGGGGQQGQWDAAQWRMLHHLEVFALGAGVEGLSATSKQVLAALGEEATPEGARSVLLRAGYWSSSSSSSKSSSSSAGAAGAPGAATASPAAPWPEETLAEAKAALERAQKRAAALAKVATPVRPGRKGPHGRHDYRSAGLGCYALDPPGSEFADDALSWDPATGKVLVHIADVQPLLAGSPLLEEAARQRGEALYLPDGPLHLLPPAALQAASLSDREPNECVTAAFTLDASTGQVSNARLILALIPPITRIRYDEANELLAHSPAEAPPHRKQAAADLHAIRALAEARRGLTQRDFSEGRRVARVKRNAATGQLEAVRFERTAAHLMVDELLALYSEAGRRFLKAHGATLPLAPGSVAGGMDAARFGTGPLRRYTDVLAQRQVAAVLRGQAPLSKTEIVRLMTQVNFQAKASRQLRAQSRTTVLMESFASYCAAQARAANAPYATVRATATGTGTEVVLPDVGLRSHVRLPADWRKKNKGGSSKPQRLFDLEAGREFDVRVLKVDARRSAIDLEFADPERDAVGVEYEDDEEDYDDDYEGDEEE